MYPEPPEPGPDPRTAGAVRSADFYDRADVAGQAELTCRECDETFDTLTVAWADAHVRETVGCPTCGLSSRIPSLNG